jgi:hypothetical protein
VAAAARRKVSRRIGRRRMSRIDFDARCAVTLSKATTQLGESTACLRPCAGTSSCPGRRRNASCPKRLMLDGAKARRAPARNRIVALTSGFVGTRLASRMEPLRSGPAEYLDKMGSRGAPRAKGVHHTALPAIHR